MRLLKRILIVTEIIIIIVTMIFPCSNKNVYAQSQSEKPNPVKVGVLL